VHFGRRARTGVAGLGGPRQWGGWVVGGACKLAGHGHRCGCWKFFFFGVGSPTRMVNGGGELPVRYEIPTKGLDEDILQ